LQKKQIFMKNIPFTLPFVKEPCLWLSFFNISHFICKCGSKNTLDTKLFSIFDSCKQLSIILWIIGGKNSLSTEFLLNVSHNSTWWHSFYNFSCKISEWEPIKGFNLLSNLVHKTLSLSPTMEQYRYTGSCQSDLHETFTRLSYTSNHFSIN
jgi:hypothetical protein